MRFLVTILVVLSIAPMPVLAFGWSMFGSSQDDQVLKFIESQEVLGKFQKWQKPVTKQIKIIEKYETQGTANQQVIMGTNGLTSSGEKTALTYYLAYAEVEYGRRDEKRDTTGVCVAVRYQKAKSDEKGAVLPLATLSCATGSPTAIELENTKKSAEWPMPKKDGICDGTALEVGKCCYQEKYQMSFSKSLGVDKDSKTGDCIPNEKGKKLVSFNVCTKYSPQMETSGMDAHMEEAFTCDSNSNWLFATSGDTCIFTEASDKKALPAERIRVVKFNASIVKMNTGECQCRELGQPKYDKMKNLVSCSQAN